MNTAHRLDEVPIPTDRRTIAALALLSSTLGAPITEIWLRTFQVLLARLSGDAIVEVVVRSRRADAASPYELVSADLSQNVGLRTLLGQRELPQATDDQRTFEYAVMVAQPGHAAASEAHVVPGTAGLMLCVGGAEAGGSLRYSNRLFARVTVDQWAGYLRRLLIAFARQPDAGFRSIPLLDAAARRRVLREWNNTYVPVPVTPFHEFVRAQARRNPDAVALVDACASLTYLELDARVRLLADRLVELGVRRETIVGACVERSASMIVAMLAIMRAGGVYLPIDPASTDHRLRVMLEDAKPRLVIASSPHVTRFQSQVPDLLDIDDQAACRPRAPVAEPAITTPEDVAYAIYTSGSTGQPKAVMVPHRGLTNLVEGAQAFGMGVGDRTLHYHQATFDLSIWETVLALPFGATLCITGSAFSGFQLPYFLEDHRIRLATLIPSALTFLIGHELPDLKVLITGAESCSVEMARYWAPRCRFFHGYGPTEITVGCTTGEYKGEEYISIGRPVQNTQIYVLDGDMHPVPPGVIGEIYVGGAGVARGYLNAPDVTASSFVPNPFGHGNRLYRTGDLGRWLASGTLAFVGRVDHQVKVGGYRIELGEVEAALRGHDMLRDIAVCCETTASGTQLVAYVVSAQGDRPSSAELRDYAAAKLPLYMVPSRFVQLPSLPTTSTGKVDRHRLSSSGAHVVLN